MSNDYQLSNGKSTTAAMANDTTRKSRKHPWHLPYLKTCIIKDCRTKPYYDGSTYFTCCLSCLREKELGPFLGSRNIASIDIAYENTCHVDAAINHNV